MKTLHTRKKQKGLSLIELMIAAALGIFIIGSVMALFINSKQSYRVQENLSRLQENGRFAMKFISQDLRMADYWGCVNPINITNRTNIADFDVIASGAISGNQGATKAPDSITIRGASFAATDVTASNPANATTTAINVVAGHVLQRLQFALVSDCSEGDIFQITNNIAMATTTISHAGQDNASNDLSKLYQPPIAKVYPLRYATYSIKTTDGRPGLYRTVNNGADQELVEDIEDMQILYGVDSDGDGFANYYKTALAAAGEMNDVVSVRISLVVRTQDDNLTSAKMTHSIFDNDPHIPTTSTAGDNRIRQVFTSTIAIRNRME